MEDAKITTIALKAIELQDLINEEGKWKKRYLLRAMIMKALFDKNVTFTDLNAGMKQALEE